MEGTCLEFVLVATVVPRDLQCIRFFTEMASSLKRCPAAPRLWG